MLNRFCRVPRATEKRRPTKERDEVPPRHKALPRRHDITTSLDESRIVHHSKPERLHLQTPVDVAFWPKTDIPTATTNVRFRG